MPKPRLELVWPGKDQFLLTPDDGKGKPVWVPTDHPAAREVRTADFTGHHGQVNDHDPWADNLLFTGDSLDVLRILTEVPEYRRHYRGKVKLIYIDPPFNTGQTFEHYDDWMEHSTWLSFMRDRLLLMRELLATDGSIWVHLDDAEQHRMRCLLDEVFGAGAFRGTILWERTTSGRNDAQGFSTDHDYLLVYANPLFAPRREAHSAAADAAYKNPDGDERGPWREVDYKGPKTADERPNLFYPIAHPFTGDEVWPRRERVWAYGKPENERHIRENLLWWGKTGNYTYPKLKKFLSERSTEGTPPRTIWRADQTDTTRRAKEELKRLFPGAPFATPKPERLLRRVLQVATDPDDIVLDVFAGSGTTAAVSQKLGRRWITAELSRQTTVEYTQPRLARVTDGSDPGGITADESWQGGGGFRTLTVGPSLYAETPVGTLLTDAATGERLSRAMAGQLGFVYQPDASPLCGSRGRMRLAVVEGLVGPDEVSEGLAALAEQERLTVVALGVLPDVEQFLADRSPGSRILKAPRDVLTPRRARPRRRNE